MKGGGPIPEFPPYWIRYIVAFWAGEHLKWVRDNILVACVCSLAPGLLAAGLSAVLSDEWQAAAHATLLTYTGLFVLFLMWRVVSTPLELDRERQRSINGLVKNLAYTKFELAALQARPPVIDVEILQIHVQAETTPASRILNVSVDRDIFLRVKLTLREMCPIEVLEYELSAVLYGNSLDADFLDDIQDWGLVTEKKPLGVGTTFYYKVSRLSKLTQRVERPGVPVEGWLHFHVDGVHERDIGATVYRLNVVTPTGAVSADIGGDKNLAPMETREFQKLAYTSRVEGTWVL
jgi:hypothetical protein